MKLLISLLIVWTVALAFGQPTRVVELFGTFGVMRGGGDDGSAGTGGVYGGTATIPFAARWALDLQALVSPLSDRPDFRLQRFLLSPGLQYRRGNDRAFWFIAFGPGLQRDHTSGIFQAGPGTVSFNDTQSGLTLHWRTGAVFQPVRRVLIRGEFIWVNRYVLPNLGVAVSIGLRLGP